MMSVVVAGWVASCGVCVCVEILAFSGRPVLSLASLGR